MYLRVFSVCPPSLFCESHIMSIALFQLRFDCQSSFFLRRLRHSCKVYKYMHYMKPPSDRMTWIEFTGIDNFLLQSNCVLEFL